MKIDVETRSKQAGQLFRQGYNCAQAVTLAYADLLPVDAKLLARTASAFGAGMGHMREVCGAVTGMFAVYSMLKGYDGPEEGEVKKKHYARIRELADRFKEEWGTIQCLDLLGDLANEPEPQIRTEEYYRIRPCQRCIECAARILGEALNEAE